MKKIFKNKGQQDLISNDKKEKKKLETWKMEQEISTCSKE